MIYDCDFRKTEMIAGSMFYNNLNQFSIYFHSHGKMNIPIPDLCQLRSVVGGSNLQR